MINVIQCFMKSYLLNNFNDGEINKILIDVKLDKNLNIKDYKINGSVKKVNINVLNNLSIQDVSLNFITDKNLTLIRWRLSKSLSCWSPIQLSPKFQTPTISPFHSRPMESRNVQLL